MTNYYSAYLDIIFFTALHFGVRFKLHLLWPWLPSHARAGDGRVWLGVGPVDTGLMSDGGLQGGKKCPIFWRHY